MKILSTSILLIIILIFGSYSTDVFASAAEKWEYDVVPDQNQKLQVTGHKVDQYGTAANEYQYKTKIDPKTSTNKIKMGTVGINRLLKVTGWGLLGNAALESLLEAVDWVIDPAAQSIWRNKPRVGSSNPTEYGCAITRKSGNDTFQVVFLDTKGGEHNCAIDAAKRIIADTVKDSNGWYEQGFFIRWQVNTPESFKQARVRFDANFKLTDGRTSSTTFYDVTTKNGEKINPEIVEKEYLKPEDLADYANHTHPDYSNPELAPKLQPKFNPQIAPDLWKPANPFEDTNSPTAQEVKRELDKASPEPKDNTIKENEPNPETGAKSFSLPAFCSWATSVCEFIDWFKKEPEKDPDTPEAQVDDKGIFNKKFDTSFLLSKQCPPDIPLKLESQYLTGNFTFSMKWLCIISTALGYPIVFASHCVGIWILYETVARKEMKW